MWGKCNVKQIDSSVPTATPVLSRKRFKLKWKQVFVFCMLVYPIAHFLIMWIFVNFDSVLLTFRREANDGLVWVGLENYKLFFEGMRLNRTDRLIIWNSLSYLLVNVLIITPLTLGIAYLFYKNMPAKRFFRIVYFLPSILPMVALVFSYQQALNSGHGVIAEILKAIGLSSPEWFEPPLLQFSIWMYCVWAGIGYGVILFGSAMSRISSELIEYGRLEGISYLREFVGIIIPLIWPTFTTMLVMGLMAPFNVYMQPMYLSPENNSTDTLALKIFYITKSSEKAGGLEQAATMGIVFSLFGAPIILLIRWFLESRYKNIEY